MVMGKYAIFFEIHGDLGDQELQEILLRRSPGRRGTFNSEESGRQSGKRFGGGLGTQLSGWFVDRETNRKPVPYILRLGTQLIGWFV